MVVAIALLVTLIVVITLVVVFTLVGPVATAVWVAFALVPTEVAAVVMVSLLMLFMVNGRHRPSAVRRRVDHGPSMVRW